MASDAWPLPADRPATEGSGRSHARQRTASARSVQACRGLVNSSRRLARSTRLSLTLNHQAAERQVCAEGFQGAPRRNPSDGRHDVNCGQLGRDVRDAPPRLARTHIRVQDGSLSAKHMAVSVTLRVYATCVPQRTISFLSACGLFLLWPCGQYEHYKRRFDHDVRGPGPGRTRTRRAPSTDLHSGVRGAIPRTAPPALGSASSHRVRAASCPASPPRRLPSP